MAFEPRELFDALRDFSAGVNSGIDPLLVERNQLAYAENATVRGTLVTNRPAYRKITLDFGGNEGLQQYVEQALWQGGCYFKPDFGNESLMAQIAGRLIQFTISGNTATVFDQSIAGDLNSSTNPIAWLWQSEQWVNCNNGISLPVFFDGNSSRRSSGAVAAANTVGVTFTAPAIGATVAVTFGSVFSGPFNTPLRITTSAASTTGYLFQAVGTGTTFTGHPITLKNITDTAGSSEAINSQVIIQSFSVGTTVPFSLTIPASNSLDLNIATANHVTVPIGTVLKVVGFYFAANTTLTGTLVAVNPLSITLHITSKLLVDFVIPASTTISGNQATSNTLVGLLYAAFMAPAFNATVSAFLDRPYTGALNQSVYINGKNYQITAIGTPVTSVNVVLLNINAPTTASLFTAGGIVSTTAELPAGRMGVYGLGRNWMSLTDGRTFVAGDIVGGSSGSSAFQFRDSVLKMTENPYLLGGGVFTVPGQGDIRAMIFVTNLDKALGQGPLQVYTPNIVFSCNAPVDRTTWQDITNPILSESMKGGGGQGQNSTINANSDTFSRDTVGIRSLILARRDFQTWGNTPVSREVQPTLNADDNSLLPFGSAVEFDNRALMTANPAQAALGVYHPKLVALNFDPVSSLRGKAASVYDGIWTGLNVLQLIKGSFGGTDRVFTFCLSSDLSKIELWEILPSDGPRSENTDEGNAPIVWDIQSGGLNFGQDDPRKRSLLRLMDGEIQVDRITSDVTFQAYYKPDQWPNWVPWFNWTETFDPNTDPGFRPRMGLGEPKGSDVDNVNNRPLRESYTYQFRLVVTGHCRFLGARFKAVTAPAPAFAPPKASGV